ncbi:MAG: hypothetical protein KDB63_10425 [Nocardioidaceae bacterium]|nr:hypothetical protein [Nocardioidaceae bacterium]
MTAADIDAAILRELEPTGEQLVCFSRVRVPGGFWEKQAALLRLYWDGLVYAIKVGGVPYVSLADECDRELAARARAEGRVREIRVA